ncbi:MAG: hypothetical protein AAGF81_01365 [Pseudomonadota bacterium]
MKPTLFAGALTICLVAVAPSTSAFPGKLSKHCNLQEGFVIYDAGTIKKEIAQFAGVFDGKWAGKLDNTLIVWEVDKTGKASGFYAWGKYRKWGINSAGCTGFVGQIADGKLKFELRNGAKVTYWFESAKKIKATYVHRGRTTSATLKRKR